MGISIDEIDLSASAKDAIEMMTVSLAGEITNNLGHILQAASFKMVQAIAAADLPAHATTEELKSIIEKALSRKPEK